MTASVLKQDPNIYKVHKNAIYQDETQHANLGGNPLYKVQNDTETRVKGKVQGFQVCKMTIEMIDK